MPPRSGSPAVPRGEDSPQAKPVHTPGTFGCCWEVFANNAGGQQRDQRKEEEADGVSPEIHHPEPHGKGRASFLVTKKDVAAVASGPMPPTRRPPVVFIKKC